MTTKVIQTKIVPPRLTNRVLVRQRVVSILAESKNYRLTILQAGAGYGKSTALATLGNNQTPLIWYQTTKDDIDPLVFLLHLCHATQSAFPELDKLPISLLESWDGTREPLLSLNVIHDYVNTLTTLLASEILLIIDDIHLIAFHPEITSILDNLISLLPTNCHILLSTRKSLQFPNLVRWQASGDVFYIDQKLLSFTPEEIHKLFLEYYKYEITEEEASELHSVTEGWAIALQLIWQSLRLGTAVSIEDAVYRHTDSLSSLFNVLAQEVLAEQSEDVKGFLLTSATLKVMDVQACNWLNNRTDSSAMLAYLKRKDLFILDLGDGNFRYHHIFHRFLRQDSSIEQSQEWHAKAAQYYLSKNDLDSVIYHRLKAQDYSGAASILEIYSSELLAKGRLDSLISYLEQLPPDIFHQHPALLFANGEIARLHSRIQEAIGWYIQAEKIWREHGQWGEVSRALRGQARVYLDIVNPSRAEDLLQQALRLSDRIEDREAQARLYELLAENKLNAGKLDQADKLRQQAERLRREGPANSQLIFRVFLRTGRLNEAQRRLEKQLKVEQIDPVIIPRAHRETLFLLSLIYSFKGSAFEAYQAAVQGTQRGLRLDSPYMTAVGHMRQGHALMILEGDDRYVKARDEFESAIEISHSLEIPRLRVEAFWGLCRAYGYQGNLTKALQYAQDGVSIANTAGDDWIAALVQLAYGASLTLAASYESSLEWLTIASRGFQACSDPFGYTVSQLWMCLGWYHQNDIDHLCLALPQVLETCNQNEYDFLFTRPTLLGVPDERILVPMLILARDKVWERSYVQKILQLLGLGEISQHPGYRLEIFTMGKFKVRRGEAVIPANGWRREKSRQLFQLLLTYRNAPLDREQIFEHLWPGADPEVSTRNFKVALSTLYNVLEPNRTPGSESTFVLREGSVYSIRPGADIWLDSAQFLRILTEAFTITDEDTTSAIQLFENALDLYKGEYLPEARYESWAAAEREHLAVQFLRGADQLCELYMNTNRYEDTIDLCQRILTQDNCWERAYRYLMLAYQSLGDHGQIARYFRRCEQTLRVELDVSPAVETINLFHTLIASV